jgi:hypothetical protein
MANYSLALRDIHKSLIEGCTGRIRVSAIRNSRDIRRLISMNNKVNRSFRYRCHQRRTYSSGKLPHPHVQGNNTLCYTCLHTGRIFILPVCHRTRLTIFIYRVEMTADDRCLVTNSLGRLKIHFFKQHVGNCIFFCHTIDLFTFFFPKIHPTAGRELFHTDFDFILCQYVCWRTVYVKQLPQTEAEAYLLHLSRCISISSFGHLRRPCTLQSSGFVQIEHHFPTSVIILHTC